MLNAGDFLQNRYEIINCIGSGGMADVFRARDHKLNRFVAIKVLKSELRSDKEFVSKFRVEAQAAAGLSHPNIVNVYDVGEEDGIYFIVMELVEGITLKAYILSKGNLSVRETTGICLQVASGLEAAHNNNIIHRDVKPQNIIISTDGTAKVADFGIARAASADTINSNVMGSVHYSAPEQSRGGFSDAKSDIYSLGITMYEMLTGRVPFDGDSTVEVALKHLQEEIISPRDIIPDLPRAIEQIILKCTQKSPDRRYQNMAQLIRDLKESLVNPNGDFVRIASENPTGATHKYSREDLEEINRRSQDPDAYPGLFDDRYDDRDAYSDDDDPDRYYDERDDDYDPDDLIDESGRGSGRGRGSRRGRKSDGGSDKIVTVISILVALAVGALILYLIIHTFDLLGGGGTNSTEKDSGVNIDLTAGTVKVPDLLGKTENEAQQILRDSNLGYKYLGETSSDEYAAGQIASQDTAAGSTVKTNTRIGYTLSIGSAQALTVPDLTNKTQADAEKALTSIGLLVSVDNTRYSDDVISGNVITTNPGAGSSVHEGDTVTIYVSQGQNSQSVQVPDTRGKYKEDAVTMLTNSGLYVYVASEPSTTVDANLVIRQDIAPGSSVQTGSSITITVSTGPENAIVINPDNTNNTSAQNGGNAGSWMCYAQLQAPQGITEGSTFRVTLEQNGTETTVFEGATSFPYLLNVKGQDGVSTGTAYVYMLDASGNVLSTTKYDGIAFYQQG